MRLLEAGFTPLDLSPLTAIKKWFLPLLSVLLILS
jgi:hypothetical protein